MGFGVLLGLNADFLPKRQESETEPPERCGNRGTLVMLDDPLAITHARWGD